MLAVTHSNNEKERENIDAPVVLVGLFFFSLS